MTLHIFNPEHDLAMACNLKNFTAPHSVRAFRTDICFLPALWAHDGDLVLVEDITSAKKSLYRVRAQLAKSGCYTGGNVSFITFGELSGVRIDTVDVWGWDISVYNKIIRSGLICDALPDTKQLESIRMLSHRKNAAELLNTFVGTDFVGEAFLCNSEKEVTEYLSKYSRIVIKAPWSCSGRGIRFAEGGIGSHLSGWIKNMLKVQGGVMVEPYYTKVRDFGMEFFCDGHGSVNYLGLSLFNTSHGAYTGGILATEAYKHGVISRYLPDELIENVKSDICHKLSSLYTGKYIGPIGVDMMIIANGDDKGFLLHPCVEINLRRTMGHVALSVSPTDDDIIKSMEIMCNNNYQLKIKHFG